MLSQMGNKRLFKKKKYIINIININIIIYSNIGEVLVVHFFTKWIVFILDHTGTRFM